MVRILPLAATFASPLVLLALTAPAEAQVVRYEFTGTVINVGTGIPDFWSATINGDPITVVYRVDANASFTSQSPDTAIFQDSLVGFFMQVGPHSTTQFSTGAVRVSDDRSAGVVCTDGYSWSAMGNPSSLSGGYDSVSHFINKSSDDPAICPVFVEDFVLPGTFGEPLGTYENFGNFALFTPGFYFIDGTVELSSVTYEYSGTCFGDGGDQMGCTDCPCANNASSGSNGGCLNTENRSAELVVSGLPSGGADSLRMEMRGGASSTFAILSSGSALAPANAINPCFGSNSGVTSPSFDGLRCAVQGILRHGTRATDMNGDVGLTNEGYGGSSGPLGGLIAANSFVAGQTRHFQMVYRDEPTLGCGTGQNTTQAVSVVMLP